MLKNDDIVSIQQDLTAGNYEQLLSGLRRVGLTIEKAWLKSSLSDDIEKYKFTSNSQFKKFLVAEIAKAHLPETANIKDIPKYVQQLKNQLSRLALVLIVWRDDPNFAHESGSVSEKKRLRQQIKFKASLDKDDRYAINIALQSIVFILCQQSNNFIKHQEKTYIYAENHTLKESENIDEFNKTINKEELIAFISAHIERLNKFESYRYLKVTNDELSLNEKQQEIEKIGKAISAFQTPNKKKKLLKYAGILLAFIAALACGLSTGGAIFLMGPSLLMFSITLGGSIFVLGHISWNFDFVKSLACGLSIGLVIFLLSPSLPLIGIILTGLTSFFGFTANFGFFSQNFPNFLLNLFKKGGLSEYIDAEGKRQQFSSNYKYVFTPLTVLFSLTVGAGATALTYITIISLFTKLAALLPILAIIWPPLPLIIAGVLSIAVAIALTVAVMTASLDGLKKVAALNLSFVALCRYAYEKCKVWLKNLDTHQKVGLAIMLLLLPVALAGLAYYRFTAGVDLSVFIGKAGAIVMGVVAFIAQVPFIYSSINKLKNAIIRPFSSTTQQTKDSLSTFYVSGLTLNATANGALVFHGSLGSALGAVACGLNSFSGNMSETDMNAENRNCQTSAIAEEARNFSKKAKGKASASTGDSNGKQLGEFKLNTKNNSSDVFPKESDSPPPTSPTRSENELITHGYGASSSHHFKLVKNDSPRVTVESRNHKTWAAAANH